MCIEFFILVRINPYLDSVRPIKNFDAARDNNIIMIAFNWQENITFLDFIIILYYTFKKTFYQI